MEQHPLRGPTRWLLLPCIGAVGGIIAGIAMTALVNTNLLSKPWILRLIGWGIFLGMAPGLAIAFTPRGWLAALIAPVLSYPLVIAVDFVLFDRDRFLTAAGLQMYLHYLLQPDLLLQVGSAILTVPSTLLHALRLKTNRTYLIPILHFAVAAVAAGLASLNEGPGYLLAFSGFCGMLALSQVAAIELALRRMKQSAN